MIIISITWKRGVKWETVVNAAPFEITHECDDMMSTVPKVAS